MPCIYLIHNDPEVFPEPDASAPSGFSATRGRVSTRVWLPFGAGPRHCIGNGLALMAIKADAADGSRAAPSSLPTGPRRSVSCAATSPSGRSAARG